MSTDELRELRELEAAYRDHARRRPIRFMERHEAPPLDDGAEWPDGLDAAYCVLRRTTDDGRSVQRTAHVATRQTDAVSWVLADAGRNA